MSQSAKSRRLMIWVFLLLVATPILLLIASELGFFPWSHINCTTQEVDIYSGRIRHSRFLLCILVQRRVDDSALTRALLSDDLASVSPEWHPVITLSPRLGYSPHYIFHSAIHQIRQLEGAWDSASFTPAARRASARRMLSLWQQSGRDDGATEYLLAVMELSLAGNDKSRTIDESDLPRQ